MKLYSALLLLAAALALPTQAAAQTCGQDRCLYFPIGSVAAIPDPASQLDGFGDFTIECWAKPSDVFAAYEAAIAKWDDGLGSHPYWIGFYYGDPSFWVNGQHVYTSPTYFADGSWHHMAFTRSGSVCTIYIDGVAENAVTFGNPMEGGIGASLGLGERIDGAESYWGDLDDVRIWNVARTPAQIAGSSHTRLSGTETGLVGYWRLDEFGQVLADSGPNGLHGTRGLSSAVENNDAGYDIDVPFYTPCGGQANSAAASLKVNGVGALGVAGPFVAGVPSGGTMTLEWSGPADQPLVLLAGEVNSYHVNYPSLGRIDLGTPPFYQDVAILLNGAAYPSYFFSTGAGGTAQQTFSMPLPPGPVIDVQGIVLQPPGASLFGVIMTAAFKIVVY